MGYSLTEFCHDVRAILRESDDRDGREQVRQKLETLLGDRDFCATYVGPGNDAGMEQIYEDPELHFCVLAYNMTEPRTSPPHDHGASWAVYGQASGHTDMTVWSTTDDDGRLEPVRTFRLAAGQAGLFDVREIHSIDYTAGAKFVRVTGVDMTDQERRVFDSETGEVREVQGVSTSTTR